MSGLVSSFCGFGYLTLHFPACATIQVYRRSDSPPPSPFGAYSRFWCSHAREIPPSESPLGATRGFRRASARSFCSSEYREFEM
ncbi:hypothetical protein BU16DRAFT_363941 [Lophium mytilinum]|uniref:Uncharacterized protein n=1 Tax=Lophium mytilinum TaxID=390894 RepID=A0A6A6QUY9_9PEZI|nr:hypothetical protein BU16DRAFT_363941 [Lophium mytilinum]